LKTTLIYIVLAAAAGAAIFLAASDPAARRERPPDGFVGRSGTRLVADGRPFRFVGANVAVMYRDEDRAMMPETFRQAAAAGITVARVWAHGEGRPEGGVMSVGGDRDDWPRTHPFRYAPGEWNEEAFLHLDRVISEAARNQIRVQLCLVNWWRDTGGVTQYLRWAGVGDAADEAHPYGINVERAMEFYTNETAKKLFREHVERIVTRRNTVTGRLYKDDPTIFSYELMNEGQAPTGRTGERRAWMAEMSALIKSHDPHHLVTTGSWGYRNAFERREWLEEHGLPSIDYCDVHNYPRDDLDTFVASPESLGEFIENRAAAAFSLNKPLVMGEFGMAPEGYKGVSQADWFRGYFGQSAGAGAAGAIFWILTPDPRRGYGVTYTTPRDADILAEIRRGAQLFASLRGERPPKHLLASGRHLVPRQFAFERAAGDPLSLPAVGVTKENALLYRFRPESARRARFEKMDGGEGYVWGAGVGFFEYAVPAREDGRRVGQIVVRAHLQPVLPHDGRGRFTHTRVTLFVNDANGGSRLVPVERPPNAAIQEWRIDSWSARLAAARGQELRLRFEVEVGADHPFGINISNFPAWFKDWETKPIEVEIR
jgi:mannan endo-1,4-beta-mannosidase